MGALANHRFEKDRDRLTARVAALSSKTLSFRQYCVRIWLNSGWIRSCIGVKSAMVHLFLPRWLPYKNKYSSDNLRKYMVMSPFEGSPPLEACTVDAILGRIFYLHDKKRVGTWASLEDGQAHVPTLLS